MAFMLCMALPIASAEGELSLTEAVRLALERNPNVLIQTRQVDVMRARTLQAAGQFDWMLTANAGYNRTMTPFVDASTLSNNVDGLSAPGQTLDLATSYGVGIGREFRNGMTLGATVGSTADYAPANAPLQQNNVKLDVSLTVPLLAGGGERTVAAQEDAARLNAVASGYDLRDRVAQTLQSVVLAYWNYRAQVELEKVAASSEERSLALLNSTQKLVDAAERPPADLVLLQADHDDKIVARQAAELARHDARQSLARLMGLDAAETLHLSAPSGVFPDAPASSTPPVPQTDRLTDAALRQRPDVKSLALHMQAAQRQLDAATRNLRPQLDLSVGVEVAKASEGGGHFGFAGDPAYTQSSPTAFARLTYRFPLQNNGARGAAAESTALLSQLAIQQRDLQNGVASDVESALRALRTATLQMQSARSGLAAYELAVKQETIKEKHGISTLMDVINTESRYENARASYVQIQLAYATALIKLRYVTGTLLPAAEGDTDSTTFSLDPATLMGLGPLAAQFGSPG